MKQASNVNRTNDITDFLAMSCKQQNNVWNKNGTDAEKCECCLNKLRLVASVSAD